MATMGQDGKNPFPVADGSPPNPQAAAFLKFLFPGYPWHAAYCGDIDLTGYRKPQSYYRDILWSGGDRVYATVRLPVPEGQKIITTLWSVYPTLPSWTWPGMEGRPMQVEVYSGAERVRLFLDDTLVGEMPTGREQQFKAVFSVPYAAGTLKAVALRGGRAVAESVLRTAGAPARLRLTPDRARIRADGQDLSYVVVEALDAQGRFQPNADQVIEVAVSGMGACAAVGSGDAKRDEPYTGNRVRLYNGRALIIVRAARSAGRIALRAKSTGLSPATVAIKAAKAAPRPEVH